MLIALRIAAQAKLDRVELERNRELVHRRFERIDGAGGAGTAHVARGREIEPGEPVLVFRMVALVEQARPAGFLPVEVLVLRRHRDRIVDDCLERPRRV
jgi:hypothetical protein